MNPSTHLERKARKYYRLSSDLAFEDTKMVSRWGLDELHAKFIDASQVLRELAKACEDQVIRWDGKLSE